MKYKVTAKTTKNDAAYLLAANSEVIADHGDKNLSDRLEYTFKHLGEAKRKDVVDLLKDTMKALGDKFIVPAAADEAKADETTSQEAKDSKEETIKDTPKDAEAEKTTKDAKDEKVKPETKKDTTKTKKVKKSDGDKPQTENLVKKPPKKDTPKTKDTADSDTKGTEKSKKESSTPTERRRVMASAFPESIKVGEQTFNIDHEVKTMADLSDEDKEYEFAFYWTKRHLKQFSYRWHKSPRNPESFPNDLDLSQLIYVSDEGVVAYCISDYTEAAYTIYVDDLEEFEGIRYCSGIEFQIYSRPKDAEEE